jgi:hypothetical protein
MDIIHNARNTETVYTHYTIEVRPNLHELFPFEVANAFASETDSMYSVTPSTAEPPLV